MKTAGRITSGTGVANVCQTDPPRRWRRSPSNTQSAPSAPLQRPAHLVRRSGGTKGGGQGSGARGKSGIRSPASGIVQRSPSRIIGPSPVSVQMRPSASCTIRSMPSDVSPSKRPNDRRLDPEIRRMPPSSVPTHSVPCRSTNKRTQRFDRISGKSEAVKTVICTPSKRTNPSSVAIQMYPSGVWAIARTDPWGSPSSVVQTR